MYIAIYDNILAIDDTGGNLSHVMNMMAQTINLNKNITKKYIEVWEIIKLMFSR